MAVAHYTHTQEKKRAGYFQSTTPKKSKPGAGSSHL
jgi:hypothetical protein